VPHGGYYSKADLAEIVAYAAERFVAVLPEIDMPGQYLDSAIHHLSAARAYRGGSHLAPLRPAQSPTVSRQVIPSFSRFSVT
jgi:N-acetyl-beta-hexosaminidase